MTAEVERRKVARDVVLTFGGRLALTAVIILGDVIVARALGPEGKGAFTLVLALTSLGAVILGLGLDRSVAVYVARSLDVARRAFANGLFWTTLAGAFGVAAIFVLYGPPEQGHGATGPLAAVMPALSSQQLLVAALALPFELLYSIGLLGLLGRQHVVAFNVLRFGRRGLLTLFLVVALIVTGLELDLVLWLNLAALALTGAGILWVARSSGVLGWRPDLAMLPAQLSFGGRSFIGTIAERLHYRANTFLLTGFVSVAATGVFSVALALSETLWYLPSAFGLVLFSRAVRPDADSGGIASAMTRTMLAVMIAVAVPLALVGPALIEIVYGAPFAAAGPALQILLPGVVAYSIVAVLSNYVIGRGAPGRVSAVLILGLAVNLAANAVLIPALGMNGAALASSISYIVTAAMVLLLYRHVSGRGLRETLIVRRSDIHTSLHHLRVMTGRPRPERA